MLNVKDFELMDVNINTEKVKGGNEGKYSQGGTKRYVYILFWAIEVGEKFDSCDCD